METKVQVLGLQGNEITIREGEALSLKHPEKIKLSGNILSISAFLSARYGDRIGYDLQAIDKSKAVIVVDKEKMVIDFYLDPQNPFGTEISAKLERTTELDQWGINQQKEFTREALIKLIRFNRLQFPDKEKYESLLRAYQSLDISTSANLKQDSDTRGNKALNFAKQVNSANIPTEFILEVPVFKGFEKKSFRVEICLDATDASVRFWLESVELKELIETERDFIFAEQLAKCSDFVIIEK